MFRLFTEREKLKHYIFVMFGFTFYEFYDQFKISCNYNRFPLALFQPTLSSQLIAGRFKRAHGQRADQLWGWGTVIEGKEESKVDKSEGEKRKESE